MNKFLLMFCFATIVNTSFAQKRLLQETFQLVQLNDNGKKIDITNNTTEIRFNYKGKAINGNVGCNNFFGKLTMPKYGKKKGKLKIEAIGSTKMFCDNMQIEQTTFFVLKEVDNFKRKANKLLLRKGKKVLLTLALK